MRRTLALAALLLAIAAPAAAQDRGSSSQPEIYDFEDDLVNGTIQAPLGEILQVHGRHARHSLIRARAHWIPELTKTVENL